MGAYDILGHFCNEFEFMESEPLESQPNMIKRMVLGNLEIPQREITGSIYHIEKSYTLGGLYLAIRQEEDLPDIEDLEEESTEYLLIPSYLKDPLIII